MEKIIVAYHTVQRACRALHSAVQRFLEAKESKHIDKETQDERRDAIIKRFELCYDLLWKYCKTYLMTYHQTDIPSPKKVFSEMYQKKVISREDADILLEIADVRNLTVHTYDETYANEAAEEIIDYLCAIERILQKIVPTTV